MSRRPARGLSVLIVTFVILIIVSAAFSNAANSIDDVHWVGNPLPPCFIDAKMCGGHVLGTDEIGRDMLARLLVGTRTSLIVSFFAISCEVLVALALALLARRFAFVRVSVSRIAVAISSISPWPYLVIISFFMFGKRVEPILGGLWLAIWAGIICWPALWRLMFESLTPEPILKKAARDWSSLVLTFVIVDFFGYGIQPPLPSLGNMLANMQQNMQIGWWVAVLPGVCVFLVVLAIEISARVDYASRPDVRGAANGKG